MEVLTASSSVNICAKLVGMRRSILRMRSSGQRRRRQWMSVYCWAACLIGRKKLLIKCCDIVIVRDN